MDVALLTVIGIVAVALVFDYTNGFHDLLQFHRVRLLRHQGGQHRRADRQAGLRQRGGDLRRRDRGDPVELQHLVAAAADLVVACADRWAGRRRAGQGGLEAIKASSVQKAVVFMVVSPVVGLVLAGCSWRC
jgi:hypothetical protein